MTLADYLRSLTQLATAGALADAAEALAGPLTIWRTQ